MEFLDAMSFTQLLSPGVQSIQLLSPHSSVSNRVTITFVTLSPRAEQPRHAHESSEHIWIAVGGKGTLLLKDAITLELQQGEVARFEDGDIHGFKNTSNAPFKYTSITSPPINFSYAYEIGP